jgi:GntR family transcriptional regulator / MocR family aminotransferase
MSVDWANSGVDLLLELPAGQRRAGLEYALRDAVRGGRLVPGTLLPSSRALAAELGMARNTVADAYGQLVAEGWLTARQGAGTRVADRAMPVAGHATARHPAPTPGRRAHDLTPGSPDLAGFPRSGWLAAARRAITAAPSHEFGYPDPRGLPGLRETLAQYLARVRGVRTTPDRIIICSGFVQALNLLSVALGRLGAGTIAVESYGFRTHREVIRAAGLATRPVTVDSSGARVSELAAGAPARAAHAEAAEVLGAAGAAHAEAAEAAEVLGAAGAAGAAHAGAAGAAHAGAVLLTPAHQFPLGVALTAQRRAAILRWARDSGGLIIEDDYDGEFRYDRRPLGALQSLAPDLVAYAGTASKSLAPGLSLAWLVLPPHLVDLLVQTKRLSDGHTGVLDQLTLEEFIRSGAYDRHIRRSRLRYRRRRDHLVALLAERSPEVTVTGIAAGMHAVLRLGRNLRQPDEAGIVSRAARAGLTIQGLGDFRYDSHPGYRSGHGAARRAAAEHARRAQPGHASGDGLGAGRHTDPGHAPGDTPGHGPGDTPSHAPGDTPGHGPGDTPGHDPAAGQDTAAALVVGYGTPPDHAFSGALDTLCDVLG